MKRNLLTIFLFVFHGVLYAQLPLYKKQNIHIYLLIGQSNMAGRGKVESVDTLTHPRVWMLTKDNQWVLAREPVQFDKPDIVGVGPALSFGKAMAEKNPDVIIALVPAAAGGSSIDVWKKGTLHTNTNSYPYAEAVTRATYAKRYGSLKGILWHQGESDCKKDKVEGYSNKLDLFIKSLRKDLQAQQVPIAVGMMADFLLMKNEHAFLINKAISNMARRHGPIRVVNVSGLNHGGDHLHFDAPSARELGRRFAELFN